MKVKITEHNIHNGVIRLRISTSLKVLMHFWKAIIVSDILSFHMRELENLGQDHSV